MLGPTFGRRSWIALIVAVVVLGCSVFTERLGLGSKDQPQRPPTVTSSSSAPPRWTPDGHLNLDSGVPTLLDGAVWLPVGSNLIRFDGQANQLPVGAALLRIQPDTGKVTGRVPLRSTGTFTFALGSLIVVTTSDGAEVINSRTLRRERMLPGGQAVAFGFLWDVRDGALLKIDLTTGRVTARRTIQADSRPYGELHLTTAAGSVWVGTEDAASVLRIDPRTLRTIATVRLHAVPGRVVMGSGYGDLWATQSLDGSGMLFRIDPDTNRVADTVALGDPLIGNSPGMGGRTIGFGNGSVWTCDSSGTVTRVDPTTMEIRSIKKLPFDTCTWLGVAGGSVWASTDALDHQYPSTVRFQP